MTATEATRVCIGTIDTQGPVLDNNHKTQLQISTPKKTTQNFNYQDNMSKSQKPPILEWYQYQRGTCSITRKSKVQIGYQFTVQRHQPSDNPH
jgi:hypothetical protein